jgi:hypothetical protein
MAGGRRWSGRRASLRGDGPVWQLERGEGSPESGVPRWHKPSGGERRRWSRGADEGTDKEVEGAPDVGAEFRAVSRSLEGDRGSISWRLNNGGTMAQWQRRGGGGKGLLTGGVLLL